MKLLTDFGANRSAEEKKWMYPALLICAALGSLAFGFVLGNAGSVLKLTAIPFAVLAVFVGFTNPELLAAMLVGITWGYVSEVLVKFHNAPSISKALVTFLIVVLLIRRFTGKRTPLVSHPLQWCVLGYFLLISAGLWYAPYPDRTWLLVIDFAKEVMLFFVIVNLISSERILVMSLWLMLLIGAALGLMTVFQEFTHNYNNTFGGFARSNIAQIAEDVSNRARAGGPTSEPNAYGQQLLVLIPIGLWAITSARTLSGRVLGIAATLACLAGAGLTFSRGTYLALAVMFILVVLHLRLNPRYLLVLPVFWLVLTFAPAEIRARFDTLNTLLPNSNTAGQEDASIRRRSVEMLMAFYMFLDHPVIGVGSDNYRALYPQYIREYGGNVPDQERNAHSYYLEIAAEHGVVGLAAIAAVILVVLRSLSNARRWFDQAGDHRMAELAVAMSIAFAGYLVSAIFLHGDYDRFFWQQVDLAAACSIVAAHAYQRAFNRAPTADETAEQPQLVEQPQPVAVPNLA